MLYKKLSFSLLLLAFCTQGFCQEEKPTPRKPECCVPCKVPGTLEAKVGYFYFADSKMRKIYNEGGWDVQLTGTYPLWRWLSLYGSVEGSKRWGKSLNAKEKTSIWQIPLSLGLQPKFKIASFAYYYFTLGPRYFFLGTNNHSPYMDKHLHAQGFGGFVNTGFQFLPKKHFLIDLFGEYSYERAHTDPSHANTFGRHIQVGGFTFGLGLGYSF